jgi:hypothetical protein
MKKLTTLFYLLALAALPVGAQTAAGGPSPGTAAPSSGATTAPSGTGTTPSAGLPGTPGTINPNSPSPMPNGPSRPISPNNPTINGANANPTATAPQAGLGQHPASTTTNMP